MTIDLRKLKAGDTVKFRNKGEAIVNEVDHSEFNDLFYLTFDTIAQSYEYRKNGSRDTHNIIDIVEIIPAPFDWKYVDTRMAFECEVYGIMWYLNAYPHNDRFAIFGKDNNYGDPIEAQIYQKDCCTRSPKNDIEVKS